MENEQLMTNSQYTFIEINFKSLSKENVENNLTILYEKLLKKFENARQEVNKIDRLNTLEEINSIFCDLYLIAVQLATINELKK